MLEMNFQSTKPGFSLDNITLATVRPWLSLREGKTDQGRWINAVITLLTMSPRERATWLISSSAEGCYPVKATKEKNRVAKRIALELKMLRMADDPSAPFYVVAKEWMKYAFDGEELLLQRDDKEQLVFRDQLCELMQELIEKSEVIGPSLESHILKFKRVDAWFSNNHDLIAEEAWEHDWLEILYD